MIIRRVILSIVLVFMVTKASYAGTIVGKVSTKRLKSPEGILVYIEKIEEKEFSPPQEPARMDQISLVFTPRVLPVVLGTTVEFHNNDDLKHNIFGVGVEDFDLGTWTKGGMRSYTFNKLGETAILCNIHSEMEAYVVVLQNPYYILTDKGGNYIMLHVPSGTYKLKTWHDRLRSVAKEIEVPEEGEIVVDFKLKR